MLQHKRESKNVAFIEIIFLGLNSSKEWRTKNEQIKGLGVESNRIELKETARDDWILIEPFRFLIGYNPI